MANPVRMSRRLFQTAIQAPSTRTTSHHLPCYLSPPKNVVRTITSSSTKYASSKPGVSFGERNDEVIASHAEKSNKKSKSPKKKTKTAPPEPVVNEDYEIGGFIDRSTTKEAKSFDTIDEKLQKTDDTKVSSEGGGLRRKISISRDDPREKKKTNISRRVQSRFEIRTQIVPSVGDINGPMMWKHKLETPKIVKYGMPSKGDHPERAVNSTLKLTKHDVDIAVRKHPVGPRPGGEDVHYSSRDTTNHKTRGSFSSRDATDHKTSRSFSSGQPLERKKTENAESWAVQKNAIKEKFDEGWKPRKKLSPDAMEGIRGLHEQDPIKYSTELLADQFKVSPEAIRRILKSKWLSQQSPEKMHEQRERWAARHDRIWDAQAELGLRPPRTKDKEIEDPDKFEQDLERRRILGDV